MRCKNPHLEEFLQYARLNSTRDAVRILLAQVGVLLIYLFIALFFNLIDLFYLRLGFFTEWFILLVSFFLLVPWWKLLLAGVNHRKQIARATRNPVLLLRPFYDNPPKPPVLFFPLFGEGREYIRILTGRTPEGRIAKKLRAVGPVIAVGKPGEEPPPYGPIILYFDDSEWEQKVEKLISISQFVVVQAGAATGLELEMRMAKKQLRPEQLIFSLNTWKVLDEALRQKGYEIFARRASEVFGVRFPRRSKYSEYIYFDPDWTPRLATKGLLSVIGKPPHYRARYSLAHTERTVSVDTPSREIHTGIPINRPTTRLPRLEEFPIDAEASDVDEDNRESATGRFKSEHKYRIAVYALLIIAAPLLFAIFQFIIAEKINEHPSVPTDVKSLFADAKWTRVRLGDSPFTVDVPEGTSIEGTGEGDKKSLPPMLPHSLRSAIKITKYRHYDMHIYVERYVLPTKAQINLSEVAARLPQQYKNALVKSLTLITTRESEGVLYIGGTAQVATEGRDFFNNKIPGPDMSYQYRGCIAQKNKEALVVMVLFRAPSVSAQQDATLNVERIISSLKVD
jgi:hypothetical protein